MPVEPALRNPVGSHVRVGRGLVAGALAQATELGSLCAMDVRGASRDRHQRLGDGPIGTACFAELLAHPATDGVPYVLETPGSRDPGDAGIPLLKRLRSGP